MRRTRTWFRLPLLAALFALAGAAPCGAAATGTPAPAAKPAAATAHPAHGTDTLLTKHSTYYDLYAPTDAQLFGTAREVQFALEQYGSYIGDRTDRIVFVVFASDAERARYDVAPLRRHQLPIVEYVGSVSGGPPRSDGTAMADAQKHNARSLAHQAGHAFFYAFVQSQLAKRGLPVDTLVTKGSSDAARGAELHRLHSRIPDWFDEAVATLCESPSNRTLRARAMAQSIDRRIPFAEFFTMKMPLRSPERAALFSNQAFTLARFIATTEGDRYIGHIAVGLIEGKFIGQCLTDATTLYSKPEALEAQYVAWLRTQTGATPAK